MLPQAALVESSVARVGRDHAIFSIFEGSKSKVFVEKEKRRYTLTCMYVACMYAFKRSTGNDSDI